MVDVKRLVRFLQAESLNEVIRAAEDGHMECATCRRACGHGCAKLSYVGLVQGQTEDDDMQQKVGYVVCASCVAITPNETDLQAKVDRAILEAVQRGERMMRIVDEA